MIYDPPTNTLVMPYKLESGTNILCLCQLLYSFLKWGLELSDSTCTGVQNTLIDSSRLSLNERTAAASLPLAAPPQTPLWALRAFWPVMSFMCPESCLCFSSFSSLSQARLVFSSSNFRWLTKPGGASGVYWIKYTIISKDIICNIYTVKKRGVQMLHYCDSNRVSVHLACSSHWAHSLPVLPF